MALGARSVTVALRSGVSDATLPNNVKMTGTKTYAISMADYAKLSRKVRDTIIGTPTINTADTVLGRFDGTNYALDLTASTYHNTAALPPKYAGASNKFAVGDVVQGFNGSAYKLVLLATTATVGNVSSTTTKNVAVYLDKKAATVSVVTTATAAQRVTAGLSSDAEFAGVFIAATTAGRYGWIQVEGDVPAAASNALVTPAGTEVGVNQGSGGTDGQFTVVRNEVSTLTLTAGGAADTFKITFNGHESSVAVTLAGSYTAVTAAQVQASINSISDFAATADQPVVTQGAGATWTITFSNGAYSHSNIGALTLTSATGAAAGNFTGTAVVNGGPFTNANGGPATVIATSLTASAATLSDVALRSKLFARRHIHRGNLFYDKN